MSFRGRGRGRGRFGGGGGGGFGYARQEPFVEFPETQLPDNKAVKEERALVVANSKFQNFWKSSAYYLEDSVSKNSESMDVERFSDWGKSKTTSKRDALRYFLLLSSTNFPGELIEGVKKEQKTSKRVRWNPVADMQKFDLFEKLEQKYQGQEEKGEKDKKEGEDEEDDEDQVSEESEEDFSDDDYNQNIDFDDDEDDYNIEEGEDEPDY